MVLTGLENVYVDVEHLKIDRGESQITPPTWLVEVNRMILLGGLEGLVAYPQHVRTRDNKLRF